MINRQALLTRIELLEIEVRKLTKDIHGTYSFGDEYIVGIKKRVDVLENAGPTLSVPVVDEHGEYVWRKTCGLRVLGGQDHHDISLAEAFEALEKMCDIEITYQEIKGSKGVVIYEKDQ